MLNINSDLPVLIKDFWSFNQRLVILSPHSDDVAYSLGGTVRHLSKTSNRTILTVFNKSCYAPAYPACATEAEVSRIRNEEDQRYAEYVGARLVALNFADASVLGHTAESELNASYLDERFEPVCDALDGALGRIGPNLILSPLSLGGHVDHRIVFEALGRSFHARRAKILYYEDLPYVCHLTNEGLLVQVRSKLGEGAQPLLNDITDVLASKLAAFSIYRSQWCVKDEAALVGYANRIHPVEHRYAERLWQVN